MSKCEEKGKMKASNTTSCKKPVCNIKASTDGSMHLFSSPLPTANQPLIETNIHACPYCSETFPELQK